MQKSDCKICRRVGTRLFLKGERCSSSKCAMVKRPYAPGLKKKKVRGRVSEYGKELIEKQKLRNWYNLSEKQFRNYIKGILEKRGKVEDAGQLLIKKLESRLDSVIFSIGFASSKTEARQMVSHGHFKVNKRKINIPSCQIRKGEKDFNLGLSEMYYDICNTSGALKLLLYDISIMARTILKIAKAEGL